MKNMNNIGMKILSMSLLVVMHSNAMDSQSSDESIGMTAYQREELKIKKEMLALHKREQRVRELDLLARILPQAIAHQNPEIALMQDMFFEVVLNDLFFEHYVDLSDNAKERMKLAITSVRERLAEKRGVPLEKVFDEDVESEARYQRNADLIRQSQIAARRMLSESRQRD